MILLVLPKEPAIRGMLLRCLDYRNHAVVCFKGGIGTGACPGSPPLPDERVLICRDPHSCEFPRHHYSGLGTRKRNHVVF